MRQFQQYLVKLRVGAGKREVDPLDDQQETQSERLLPESERFHRAGHRWRQRRLRRSFEHRGFDGGQQVGNGKLAAGVEQHDDIPVRRCRGGAGKGSRLFAAGIPRGRSRPMVEQGESRQSGQLDDVGQGAGLAVLVFLARRGIDHCFMQSFWCSM